MTGGKQSFEVLVAVHVDKQDLKSVLVSIDGENKNAKWIARSLIRSFHLTGQSTRGTDRDGQIVTLPLAHMTIPEWLATKQDFT